jgi:hypothetical protein
MDKFPDHKEVYETEFKKYNDLWHLTWDVLREKGWLTKEQYEGEEMNGVYDK